MYVKCNYKRLKLSMRLAQTTFMVYMYTYSYLTHVKYTHIYNANI